MGDTYNKYDPFADADMHLVPIEEQLAKGLSFIQEHREKLGEIEGAINESISEVWETQSDPVALHLQPVEKVEVLDLVNPARSVFKKIITVLAVLCDEITDLKVYIHP